MTQVALGPIGPQRNRIQVGVQRQTVALDDGLLARPAYPAASTTP